MDSIAGTTDTPRFALADRCAYVDGNTAYIGTIYHIDPESFYVWVKWDDGLRDPSPWPQDQLHTLNGAPVRYRVHND